MALHIAAVVVAAGSGKRFGRPKANVRLAGKPMAERCLAVLASMNEVKRVVLVAAKGDLHRGERSLRRAGVSSLEGRVVEGGRTRHDSVARGVAAIPSWRGVIVVHDAARPLVRAGHVASVARAAQRHGAAALARPAADTCAIFSRSASGSGALRGYVARENLCHLETPQAFRASWWRRAASCASRPARGTFTDETSFLHAAGLPVRLVFHAGFNGKITTPADLALAEAWLKRLSRGKGRPS